MTFAFPVNARFGAEPSDPVGDLFSSLGRGDIISFAGGAPDGDLFEADAIAASFAHVLSHHGRRALQYGSTPGEPELREAAARLMSRNLPTTADQIQVTSGSQEGIFLAAQAMLSPGDVVLVEQPTYLAAIQAFLLNGARLVGVATDDDGVEPDALAAAIAAHRPKFLYLVPTFQNPSGRSMPLERRRAVTSVLLRTGVALVEDDPYRELRFEGDAVPPIAALPGMAAQTILLNSLSKIVAPGVRVGWMRSEGSLKKVLGIAKSAVTLQSGALTQLAMAHYLTHNDLDAHLARVVEQYRTRRDVMYSGLRALLPASAHITRPLGGMFCWVTLGDGSDTAELLEVATQEGVAFVPGWSFFPGEPDRATMRLTFVTNPPDTIREGLRRLAAAMDVEG